MTGDYASSEYGRRELATIDDLNLKASAGSAQRPIFPVLLRELEELVGLPNRAAPGVPAEGGFSTWRRSSNGCRGSYSSFQHLKTFLSAKALSIAPTKHSCAS